MNNKKWEAVEIFRGLVSRASEWRKTKSNQIALSQNFISPRGNVPTELKKKPGTPSTPNFCFATMKILHFVCLRCFSIYFSSRCCFVSIKLISFRYTCATLCASQLIVLRDVLHIFRTLASFVAGIAQWNVFIWKLHFSPKILQHNDTKKTLLKMCVDDGEPGTNGSNEECYSCSIYRIDK